MYLGIELDGGAASHGGGDICLAASVVAASPTATIGAERAIADVVVQCSARAFAPVLGGRIVPFLTRKFAYFPCESSTRRAIETRQHLLIVALRKFLAFARSLVLCDDRIEQAPWWRASAMLLMKSRFAFRVPRPRPSKFSGS